MKYILLVTSLLLGGCVGHGQWGSGAHWPNGQELASAAKTAATAPQTWAPIAFAGLLIGADVDNQWSADIAENQKIFGDDAKKVSDDLLDVASAAYLVTALLAPSDTFADKAKGLAVGASTMILDGALTTGVKNLVGRERPDGANDKSMPSGHTSMASSRTAMAIHNLNAMDLPEFWRQTATWSLHGVAVGTGLARVEAEKHHLSDVLVGYALGQFVAQFMHQAFLVNGQSQTKISFAPAAGGGAFTLTIPFD